MNWPEPSNHGLGNAGTSASTLSKQTNKQHVMQPFFLLALVAATLYASSASGRTGERFGEEVVHNASKQHTVLTILQYYKLSNKNDHKYIKGMGNSVSDES